MKINISVLNVKDGDAIIILLIKNDSSFIILIDGGHKSDSDLIISKTNNYLKETEKKAPDLIICTHYDNDHIGGLKAIIEYYKSDIKQILIHNIKKILEIPEKICTVRKRETSIFPSESDLTLKGSYDYTDYRPDKNMQIVLETLRQESELIGLINKYSIPCTEPVAGKYGIANWPEFEIIGPTEAYYTKLFPVDIDIKEYIRLEAAELTASEDGILKDMRLSPCEVLDSQEKSKLTNTNLNSAIVKITIAGKIFLFTGDAGVESFENIPEYQKVLKDIYWLKVPHHGSRNNINCNLIKLMSPKYAVVSGDKHISESVINCLKYHEAEVLTTRDFGDHIEQTFYFNKESS